MNVRVNWCRPIVTVLLAILWSANVPRALGTEAPSLAPCPTRRRRTQGMAGKAKKSPKGGSECDDTDEVQATEEPVNTTLSPSSSPTPAVPCVVNDDGSFGSMDASANVTRVQFLYAVELDSANATQNFSQAVLPVLEDAFTANLLSVFFSDQCVENTTSVRKLKGTTRRQLASSPTVAGISSMPDDIVSMDVDCEGDHCIGVVGGMSLYTVEMPSPSARRFFKRRLDEEVLNETDVSETLRDALRDGMGSGTFDTAHPSIVKVSFVEGFSNTTFAPTDAPTASPVSPPGQESRSINNSGDDVDDIHIIIWPIVGGVALLGAGYMVYRRRGANTSTEEEGEEDEEAEDKSDSPPPPPVTSVADTKPTGTWDEDDDEQ